MKTQTNTTDISIIIVNFNGRKLSGKCLNSVFLEKAKSFEVIVVDDGSTDKSTALLEKIRLNKYKQLQIIALEKNVGAAEARNIGARKSTGKYLFFLDNDTELQPDWHDKIINFFDLHNKVGLAQVKILKKGTKNYDYAGDFLGPFGFLIERARGAIDIGQFDYVKKIFALKSAAMIIRREVFKTLGGFDKDYHIFLEDTDIAWRCWLIGYEVVFLPTITVYHAYGTKEKDQIVYIKNQVVYRGCRNTIMTLIKNLGLRKLIFILPANTACWLVLAILFFIRFDTYKGFAILKGIFWNTLNLGSILKKRRIIQSSRKITDEELLSQVGAAKDINYYLGKGLAYLQGKSF